MPKAPIKRISVKVKEIKVGTMRIKIERASMFEMESSTGITTSIGVSMVTEMIGVRPMYHLKNWEVSPRDSGGNLA